MPGSRRLKLKQMTLRWSEADAGFDTRELDAFCADNDVLNLFEHFFVREGDPSWALLLTFRPRSGPDRMHPATDGTPKDPRVDLPPETRTLYDALRKWRNDRARRDGKPPYVIFTNNQMIALAQRRPTTKVALGEVPGVGEAKLAAFGDELVALLRAIPEGLVGAVTVDEAGEPKSEPHDR